MGQEARPNPNCYNKAPVFLGNQGSKREREGGSSPPDTTDRMAEREGGERGG